MHFLNLLSQEKSTLDEKVHFKKGKELKLTQVELLSFFIFKSFHDLKQPYLFLLKL